MSQLLVIATAVARPEQTERLEQLFSVLISATLAEEGCLSYDLCQSAEDPLIWVVLENWRSQAALDSHSKTLHFLNFLANAGRVVIVLWT